MDVKYLLDQRWVHSHEEDSEGVRVFRRDDFSFPRSRGRSAFTLSADGTAVLEPPAPTDRGSRTVRAHWTVQNTDVVITPDEDGAGPLRVDIDAAAPDRVTAAKS